MYVFIFSYSFYIYFLRFLESRSCSIMWCFKTSTSTSSNVQVQLEQLLLWEPWQPGRQMATKLPHKWWMRDRAGQRKDNRGSRGSRHNTSWAPWYVILLLFFFLSIKCFFELRTTLMMTNGHTHHHMPSPSPEQMQAWGAAASQVLGKGSRCDCILSPCQVCFFYNVFLFCTKWLLSLYTEQIQPPPQ